jgi:hypothetical protein
MTSNYTSMGIILSGAYIASSMVSEFGLLPPAFLPLANKRLYCQQVESLRAYVEKIMLTLPNDFEPKDFDDAWLNEHGVTTRAMDASKTLGQAVADCLEQLPPEIEEVWILFGDTLITELSHMVPHSLAMGIVQEHSRWGYCREAAAGHIEFYEDFDTAENEMKSVVAGCFRLSRSNFDYCLSVSDLDFYDALGLYSLKYELHLIDTSSSWYDFGHINAYFRSRQNFTTERAFNNIHIEKRKVAKYSGETLKMLAEVEWFENVPRDIAVFLPSYRGRSKHNGLIGYATEYLFLPLISDLFVYTVMPEYVWRQIFRGCKEFLEVCHGYPGGDEVASESWWLYADKTRERLDTFGRVRGISLEKEWLFNGKKMPSLSKIFETILRLIPQPTADHISVIHGDFHFANIFFDFRSLGVKAIDPRGIVRGLPTIYGDYRYDLAKLAHSVYGLYDLIVAGILTASVTDNYEIAFVVETNESILKIQNVFGGMTYNGLFPQSKEIRAIVVLLFLSMLPLHSDRKEKQDTLLANVFRLYAEMEGA